MLSTYVSQSSVRIGCDSYSLPDHIREHIDFITPGVKLSLPQRKRIIKRDGPGWSPHHEHQPHHRKPHRMPWPTQPWNPPPPTYSLSPVLQACNVNITPPCLRALYGIPPGHINDSVNTLGFYEQGDYYAAEDLDLFFKHYAPWVPQGTRPILKGINGGYAPSPVNNSNVGGEADLDLDIGISLTYPQSVVVYQVDDAIYALKEVALVNTFNTFLDALDGSYCNYSAYGITGDSPKIDPTYPDPAKGGYKGQLQCGVYKPTRVISISFGESEEDLPKAYVERQ